MKIQNGTLAAYHSWTHRLVIPDNLEFYLAVNCSASKVIKTSRGWKPVGWEYTGMTRPYVPVKKK